MARNYEEHPMDGHESDGIKEFDNNLPRWWLYGFYFTVVFSIAYLIHYHVLNAGDVMKQEYQAEVEEASVRYKLAASKPAGTRTMVALTDPQSLEAGKKMFTGDNLCHTCHRADGGGLVGPNLTDDYWIHGNTLDSIVISIERGYPEKGMLPYGNSAKLTDEQVLQLASFVLSLHGTNPPNPKPVDPAVEKQIEWKN